MTAQEADDLAKRIINAWRGGPPLNDWREELARLDAGMAGTAFVRLRRTIEDAPSIARFLAEYRAVRGPDIIESARPQAEGISVTEYLNRVAARAASGDADAELELARWNRRLAESKESA